MPDDPADERQWTPQQRAAITHAGGGLLVSAAAGSGKTSVLAERCAHLVCDAADPCSVHELLVVTFTEAAAGEMKNRIGEYLKTRHKRKPDDHTARQLALLDRASISTLHGFCARLLRQHFHLLGLDPAFRILDGDEAKLLKAEVAADLFARRYDDAGEAGRAFRSLIDHYGDGKDERLIDEVIAAHESLCSVVDPAGWAAAARDRLAAAAARPLAASELGSAFQADVARDLAGVRREFEAAERFVRQLGRFDEYETRLGELVQIATHLLTVLDTGGVDAVRETVDGLEFKKLRAVPNSVPDKEAAKDRVDKAHKLLREGAWRKRLRFTGPQWQAGMAATLPHAATLLSLVDGFGAEYTRAKESQGGLDFNDLERLTLTVLGDGGGRPSALARTYHAQFRHVLVDEFQDINEVQDAILSLLSRECLGRPGGSNLFCVGDVKQSIYRFRLADPARFLARRDCYADPDRGTVIDLQQNFRSRGPLLDAVNAVFAKLMTRASADLDYDESQRLVFAANFPAGDAAAFTGGPVELHLMPADAAAADDGDESEEAELDRSQREAVLIGHQLRGIVGRRTVADRDGTVRPARYGDCVVLLRSMRFKADTFAGQLRAMGVPVHSESNTGYFEATEVNDVLSLLHVLDNGRQDVPLAALLRSPLAAVPQPEDALARIRLAYPAASGAMPFHVAVRTYAAEQTDDLAARLNDLLGRLARWRQAARDRPVAELLWAVYDETGYLAFCGGLPRGEQRQANLLELHDRARQFGDFRRQGLGKFLAFLEKLRGQSDLGQATVASEADDAVRVMSIHRSKGLEFPVVFVPDLGKMINVADLSGSILLDRQLGLGLRVIDPAAQVRYPSLAWTVVQQRLRQQALAEELRVLYVALTRAKEHLVLIGTGDPAAVDRWRQAWERHDGPLPAETVLAARTPLDWLGPTAVTVGEEQVRLIVHAPETVAAWSTEQATPATTSPAWAALAELEPLAQAPPLTPAAAAVIGRIGHAYRYADLAAVEAATAVTTLAKPAKATGGTGVPRLPDPPRFLAAATPVGAADRGTATHVVLEHLNFAAVATAADVRSAVDGLTAAHRLTPDMAAAVDVDAIAWFLDTDVGRRLRAAGSAVRREVPVYFAHPPATGPAVDRMDQVMVRGRLDLLVPDGDGWLIVDYKTDRVDGAALDARVAEYAQQLVLYGRAIRTITHRRVTGAVLVFLTPREVRPVALAEPPTA